MAFECGQQVSDPIADWVKEAYATGPVDKCNLPKNAKISGIMTKSKSNGLVRVMFNLSAPAGRSVNEGINNTDFTSSMLSTRKWLRILHNAGVNCYNQKLYLLLETIQRNLLLHVRKAVFMEYIITLSSKHGGWMRTRLQGCWPK